jgi:hypothetical protein
MKRIRYKMSTKQNKTKNPLKKWYIQKKAKLSPINRAYYGYFRNILSNSVYRIILVLTLLFESFVIFLFLSSSTTVSQNWVSWGVIWGGYIIIIYIPLKYFYANFNQLSFETEVNKTIRLLKLEIKSLSEPLPFYFKNYRSFQAKITQLRTNLIDFLENSEIVSPPIPNFEFNRLKKRIDIFFNCVSEVLVPINKLFSYEEEIDAHHYGTLPDEEFETEHEEEEHLRETTGQFTEFDLNAMAEFLDYLWGVLFEKETEPYSPLHYKHPVNMVLLSRFFDSWNKKIAACQNCKVIFKKASDDIEAYYASVSELESERRQRRWKLRDDVIVVIASVGISTLIQYLISLAK